MKSIVFLTYEGAQLLDVAGPASVFAEANEFVRKPTYQVVVASPRGGPVSSRGGVTLATVPVLDIAPGRIDTLIVSGGIGEPLRTLRRSLTSSLCAAATRSAISRCTGSSSTTRI